MAVSLLTFYGLAAILCFVCSCVQVVGCPFLNSTRQWSSMAPGGMTLAALIPTELWARSSCCTLHQCCYIFACPPPTGNLQQTLSRNIMTMMSKWRLNHEIFILLARRGKCNCDAFPLNILNHEASDTDSILLSTHAGEAETWCKADTNE